eukprot:gene1931-1071_t
MLGEQWVRWINATFTRLQKIKTIDDLSDGVHMYKMLCEVSPSFDIGNFFITNKKKNLDILVEHIGSYYCNVLQCEVTFDLNMEELYEGNRQEIISILQLVIGIIFAPKYPSNSRDIILKNMKTLSIKDQESIMNVIDNIVDRYDLDYKEKSFNISTTSTSSPFLSRKSFSNQMSIFEDRNRELIEEIDILKLKIQEDLDSKKRLEEIVKSLKSSNKNIEKKNEELKKKNKIYEKENKNYEERNKELELTIENLMKNNTKFKKEYEKYLNVEKEKKEFERKYNYLKERINDENKNSNSKIEELIKLNQSLNQETKKIKSNELNQFNDLKLENENLKKQLLFQQNVFFKELKEAKDNSNLELKLISSTFYSNQLKKLK